MEKVKLIENSSELGAGTRGASLGVDAMKIASIKAGSKYFTNHQIIILPDNNDLLFHDIKYDKAKRINGVIENYELISKTVKETFENGEYPIVLSGDHSCAGGTIAGIKMAHPDKRLGVIWIDAHADVHSPYTSPSGNIHGMPLATALNVDNKEHQVKEITEELESQWKRLKNMGGISPKILPSDLVYVAVRDTEEPEDYYISKNNVKNYSVEQVRRTGYREIAEEILAYLGQCDLIYISFDVDSMDCDLVSYGTGTPVPNGLTEQEAGGLINNLLIDKRVGCFEIVEINPCLDNKQNKMAETAFRILESATAIIEKRG
ncbi:MAG: arginase [Flavobacteriales bacterium]|nr:arginase [Flavobacteriales bacterium]MCB9198494.1 arginase [Flavobacteriales bacterium]